MIREAQIEEQFIKKLKELKYTYREDIRDKKTLDKNFREKFEALNRVNLTESEFERLKADIINPDVFAASKLLRTRNYFQREDGTPLHYTLVNIKDWCKNEYEVINQLKINTDNSNQRYDVIILINGIPVVQVELKTLEVQPRKAMQQIVDYKNEPGNGYTNSLMCFMQLFIVSNRSNTLYFANNKIQHFSFDADEQFLPVYQYADEQNKKITHIDSFAEKFLPKCTLGELISKYMVLIESEQKLLIMRPYQIYAVKAIVDCIHQNRGNGYIWHTTGSGKTLTSFKASTLLKDNPDIEKCLFVVDRKDLDRQTREEFNKFQEGSVEENTNTETLVRRLLSTDYADKVIVTTIQKLGLALDENNRRNYKERLEPLSKKRVVFIFDECHRSQFGDNHRAIKEFFPNAQLFGFTGTPIFDDNATYNIREGEQASYKTTDDIFEKQLHAYTITHAIDDKNVLRFHVDYFKGQGNVQAKPGEAIAQQAVVEAILDKHNAATSSKRFNAVLATASINNAIEYYRLFKEIQIQKKTENPNYVPVNIACVFSPPAEGNKDIQQIQEDLEQEKEDNKHNPDEKKAALKTIINDYNRQYKTNHSINEFDLYYQDVQKRIKDHKYSNADYPHENKIDITIVVDMLLTGFDSKYLNTLYVDKNLKYHGLIQAFSRTNRVLNDTKPYGNILDFRHQQEAVNTAIALFSGEKDDDEARKIWLVDSAPVVIEKYKEAVAKLGDFMEKNDLVCEPDAVYNLKGDAARIAFVKNFKEVQRLKTQLDQYTDIDEDQQAQIEAILPEETLRSFRSSYIETAKQFREIQQKEGDQAPVEVQQLDFEFVLFASALIDYDYIMELIADSTQKKPTKQKMTKLQIISLLTSSSNLMDEQEDLTDYINSLDWDSGQDVNMLREGYETFKIEKNNKELVTIAHKHGIPVVMLKSFTDQITNRMIFDGEKLTDLLEPLELSWKERRVKELALMEDLVPHLKKQVQGREISGLAAYG
ncbi:type I restriction enzyme R subunit [Dysgonomonas sp. PFB1-18]|uniref:type I restriction endonuclease subunit R n=1 Tax=unclassified Dysgonomonas TaxID=2630389 RepID=UPI002473E64D|nr:MULTISPECIES: type I restriction endonuclease subunit R [unclassified Dysgonomonas]MDH6310725.1 type I restriction enzyme R subunit [Dysgonomonas sp. PF1-14]MDH6340575.1 type I restriction enzyme R subunit [Dysgonomonas sp. PF1-16]MDH6382168.1 type I restriction enzyme R subunit [Dysgonomonas sp. PFB1-18]MDH6399512.1 type I restriction enzyme R subunit [Dysgonomonas sp. PF1-23]